MDWNRPISSHWSDETKKRWNLDSIFCRQPTSPNSWYLLFWFCERCNYFLCRKQRMEVMIINSVKSVYTAYTIRLLKVFQAMQVCKHIVMNLQYWSLRKWERQNSWNKIDNWFSCQIPFQYFFGVWQRIEPFGQWLWLSWYSRCFRHLKSAVRIQSSANVKIEYFHTYVNCIEKMKIKKKRPGMALLENELNTWLLTYT